MRRTLAPLVIFALSLTVMFVWGCNSDDTNPTEPGDPNDPEYQLFTDEFDGIDDVTGLMSGFMFYLIDSIGQLGQTAPPMRTKAALDFSASLAWSSAANAWVATVDDYESEDGTIFGIVDTVRFHHGAQLVQWPDSDSLTQIDSYCWVTASGEGDGTAFQRVSLTRPDGLQSPLLQVDGNGSIEVTFTSTDSTLQGVTTCEGTVTFTSTFNGVVMNEDALFDTEGEMNCPQSGSIAYTGAVSISCTGANTASVTGQWSVTQAFNNGTVTTTISNGSNTWTATENCGFEPDYTADSIVVSDVLNPETIRSVFNSLDLSLLLLDSIPIQGASRPLRARSTLDDTYSITAIHSYTYSAGWHIFDFEAMLVDSYEADTSYITAVDSIQIIEDGSPAQFPSAELNDWEQMLARAHGMWEQNGSDSYGHVNHRAEVELGMVGQDLQATINASVRDTLSIATHSEELGECSVFATLNEDIEDVILVVGGEGCPTSGTVTATSSLDADCYDEGSDESSGVDGTWSVTVTSNGTTTTTVYSHGTFTWTVTESCGVGTVGAPGSWALWE